MKRRNLIYLLLFIFNLLSLYFIIDMFSYDEITGHYPDGEPKISSSKHLAYLLYVTCLFNIYFLSYRVIKRVFKEER